MTSLACTVGAFDEYFKSECEPYIGVFTETCKTAVIDGDQGFVEYLLEAVEHDKYLWCAIMKDDTFYDDEQIVGGIYYSVCKHEVILKLQNYVWDLSFQAPPGDEVVQQLTSAINALSKSDIEEPKSTIIDTFHEDSDDDSDEESSGCQGGGEVVSSGVVAPTTASVADGTSTTSTDGTFTTSTDESSTTPPRRSSRLAGDAPEHEGLSAVAFAGYSEPALCLMAEAGESEI